MSKLLTIGLHCNHDASVTICKGDNVLCTIAEERVTGIKHYAGFPYNSLIKALEYTKLKGEKADVIAFSSEKLSFVKIRRRMEKSAANSFSSSSSDSSGFS